MSKTNSGNERGRGSMGDTMPLYQIIVNALRSEIQKGIYPVDSILPSETDLMARFGVSRHTVRTAIRSLNEAGIVRTHHGLGTLVNARPDRASYMHKINTISDLFPKEAISRFERASNDFVLLPPSAKTFPELSDSQPWLRIAGARSIPGAEAPFNEFEVFVASRFAGVGRVISTETPSVYSVLESIYGETIQEVEQVIGGFIADGEVGAKIGLQAGDPGIEVRRIHRITSDDSIGIVSFNRYPLSEYTFSMTLRRIEQ